MNHLKMKVLDQLLEHLDDSQGMDLRDALEKTREPKGLKVESVEIMGDKPEIVDVADNGDQGPSLDPEKVKQFQKGFNESGGWQPERWKKNLKEGLGITSQNEMEPSMDMGDDELEELMSRFQG
jgi:hypothetical protein